MRCSDMVKMRPDDPAYWMLFDGVETTPTIYDPDCYICNDPEYAKMGLPLCYACPVCGEHVAADMGECDHCGWRGEVVEDAPDQEVSVS